MRYVIFALLASVGIGGSSTHQNSLEFRYAASNLGTQFELRVSAHVWKGLSGGVQLDCDHQHVTNELAHNVSAVIDHALDEIGSLGCPHQWDLTKVVRLPDGGMLFLGRCGLSTET
jgi:hypothetical protein